MNKHACAGHKFCTSVEIEESPGSYACMHAAVKDVDVHKSWFYYYLSCSGRVGAGWEAFCSLVCPRNCCQRRAQFAPILRAQRLCCCAVTLARLMFCLCLKVCSTQSWC